MGVTRWFSFPSNCNANSLVLMFDGYSLQSIHVILIALRKAEKRGATALDIDDILAAWIVEDQGGAAEAIFDEPSQGARSTPLNPPRRFLPPDIASGLLTQVQVLCTRSQPLPQGSEMPISESLKRALGGAVRLRDEMQQREVQPLHLLAAVLAEDSNQAVQVFTEAGITRESVLRAIREEIAAVNQRRPLIAAGTAAAAASPAYSGRARNVNFLARHKARMRGSGLIEVEDLLVALLIEDQGDFLDALSETPGGIGIDITHVDLRPHAPALATSMADDLLAHVEARCDRSEPLPPDTAIPMSETVKRIFAVADLLRDALQQHEVEPLHLLAAILEERSDEAVQIVLEAGITREKVLKEIRGEAK